MSDDNETTTPFQWFAWDKADTILQAVFGSISTLSSGLIIYVILRSREKLRSTYHRIMFILSSFELCFSFALALSTLPMPPNILPYETLTLGNYGTCIAQGIVIQIAYYGSTDCVLILIGYYLLVAFNVDRRKIAQYYEPIMYSLSFVINATVTYVLYQNSFFSIRPWSAFCGPCPIPLPCFDLTAGPDVNCDWPDPPHIWYLVEDIFKWGLVIYSIVVTLVLTLVIAKVFCEERKLIKEKSIGHTDDLSHQDTSLNDDPDINFQPKRSNDDEMSKSDNHTMKLKYTRTVAIQAFMYVSALYLTWIIPIITIGKRQIPRSLDAMESVLLPLTGFYTMLIFCYFKIVSLRQSDQSITSNFQALKIMLRSPNIVPMLMLSGVNNISIEDRDDGDYNEEDSNYASHPSQYDGLSENSPCGPASIDTCAVSFFGPVENNIESGSEQKHNLTFFEGTTKFLVRAGGKCKPHINNEETNEIQEDSISANVSSTALSYGVSNTGLSFISEEEHDM